MLAIWLTGAASTASKSGVKERADAAVANNNSSSGALALTWNKNCI